MPYGAPANNIAGSIVIGTPVVGGNPYSVLFVSAAGDLDDDPNFLFDDANGQLLLGNGTEALPSYSFVNDQDTGIYFGAANEIVLTSAAAARVSILGSKFALRGSSEFGWAAGTPAGNALDTILARDAANIIAQRNSTNAQTHRIYNTFTDASNYERADFVWSGNVFNILTGQAGTGTARTFVVGTSGAAPVLFSTNNTARWRFTSAGIFQADADNTYDIGATGASRPRSIFVGTSIQIEANNGLRLTNQVNGAGANAGTLANAPTAGNPAIWIPVTINGANRFIPAWA